MPHPSVAAAQTTQPAHPAPALTQHINALETEIANLRTVNAELVRQLRLLSAVHTIRRHTPPAPIVEASIRAEATGTPQIAVVPVAEFLGQLP